MEGSYIPIIPCNTLYLEWVDSDHVQIWYLLMFTISTLNESPMGVPVEIGVPLRLRRAWLASVPTFDEMTAEALRLFLDGKKEGRAESVKYRNQADSEGASKLVHSLCEQARHTQFQIPV